MSAPMPKSVPAPIQRQAVKPPSVLLIGPSGTGKTYSLSTILEAGLELFVVITEPNGLDTLLDAVNKKGLDVNKLHWRYIEPATPGWDALGGMAKQINMMGYDDLSKLKSGINKRECTQMMQLLEALHSFECDHCGQNFGDVSHFDTSRALAIDSLSGLNVMAMDLTIGMKPTAHQGEWGVAMNLEEKLILQLTSSLKCMFVLTGHVDKEPDLISGAQIVTASALGRKLAPKLGRFFSEVVMTKRGKDSKSFVWSTADVGADLKVRGLEFSDQLSPSFGAVWKFHEERMKSLQPRDSAA